MLRPCERQMIPLDWNVTRKGATGAMCMCVTNVLKYLSLRRVNHLMIR